MGIAYRSIFFLKSFSTGILMPVMSLLLLAKGASLNSLAWMIGAYSLTVVLMEFPTGVFSDLFGRKKTFLVSCALMLLSLVIIFLFSDVMGALVGILIQGVSRAFASGSLDALVIEQGRKTEGEIALAKISGELNILESLGIAGGSLAGGILAGMGSLYRGNLLGMIVCYVIITVLVIFYVREGELSQREEKNNLWKQAGRSISYTFQMPDLARLMILIFITGMVFFTIETYWQPFFTVLPKADKSWKLGLVTFSGFIFTAVGSQAVSNILAKSVGRNIEKCWWKVLLLTKASTALCILLFAWQKNVPGFISAYSAVYLFHGGSSVAENSLLSKLVPDHMRASIMSLFSLLFQAGALAAAGIAGGLVAVLGIAELWIAAGGVLIFTLVVLGVSLRLFYGNEQYC